MTTNSRNVIGITGATGQLGRHVVSQLKEHVSADNIVALVRSPEKAADLGIAARKADYSQRSELNAAMKGIDTLLLISSNEIGHRAAHHHNIIEVAKKAGVSWIIYTSLLHADTSPISLAGEHRETEAELRSSGIDYTILRNGWYIENYAGSIQGALAGGAWVGSAGEGKISAATRSDYAAAAVAVLTSDGHKRKVYELAGDTAWTMSDMAEELSKQAGREIPYTNMSESDYAAVLQNAGLPEGMAAVFARFDTDAANGALFHDSGELSTLIGRPTTTLEAAIAEMLPA